MKANANKTNIKLMGLHLTGHRIRHQNAVFYSWSSYICCPHHCLKIAVSLKNKAIYMNKQLISLINFLINPFSIRPWHKLQTPPREFPPNTCPLFLSPPHMCPQTKWEQRKKNTRTHSFLNFCRICMWS